MDEKVRAVTEAPQLRAQSIPRPHLLWKFLPKLFTGYSRRKLSGGGIQNNKRGLFKLTTHQQQAQKQNKEKHRHSRLFGVGDRVMARNFAPGVNCWIPGIVMAIKKVQSETG